MCFFSFFPRVLRTMLFPQSCKMSSRMYRFCPLWSGRWSAGRWLDSPYPFIEAGVRFLMENRTALSSTTISWGFYAAFLWQKENCFLLRLLNQSRKLPTVKWEGCSVSCLAGPSPPSELGGTVPVGWGACGALSSNTYCWGCCFERMLTAQDAVGASVMVDVVIEWGQVGAGPGNDAQSLV